MALTNVQRARIIMDLVKDGNVGNEANYGAGVDKIAVPTAGKYADAFIDVFGPVRDSNGEEVVSPTAEQKALFYINRLRAHHRDVLLSARVPAAAETARTTEQGTVNTEVDTEVGTPEEIT